MKEDILPYSIKSQNEIVNQYDTYPLIDDSQIRGGLKVTMNKTDRNNIPYFRRGYGVVKCVDSFTETTGNWIIGSYVGADLGDVNWSNEDNWSILGGGSNIDCVTDVTLSGDTLYVEYSDGSISGLTIPLSGITSDISSLETITSGHTDNLNQLNAAMITTIWDVKYLNEAVTGVTSQYIKDVTYSGSTLYVKNEDDSVDSIVLNTSKENRYDSVSPYRYMGKAPFGSIDTDSVWSIVRMLVNNNGTITTASANGAKWSDRLTTIYN